MRLIIILLTLSLATALGSASAQECNPRFLKPSQTVTVNDIKVAARGVAREPFNILIVNENHGSCSVRIRFSRLSGTALSATLRYQLQSGSRVIDVLPNETTTGTSESDLFVGGIPGGENGRAVPIMLSLPSNWDIESGFHSEQLQADLIGPEGQSLDTLVLTLNVDVPQSVSIRLVGARGSGDVPTVDLGNITQDDVSVSNPFGVRVWSTSPYMIAIESENMGYLRHLAGLDAIPYELRIDNRSIDLSTRSEFIVSRRTLARGRVHRMRVRAGPTFAHAGDYADRVTVTVSAI